MNADLLASLLAALTTLFVILLTAALVPLTFPGKDGVTRCPRWLPLTWHIRWLELSRPLRRLAAAIHIAWGCLSAPERTSVILAAEDDWDLLAETLSLDAESSAFDISLRREISAALDKVTILG